MEDPESRVRCENCGLRIRKVDAKHQNGRCHPCDLLFRRAYQEKIKKEFRKSPPESQEEIERLTPHYSDSENMWLGTFLASIRPPLVDPLNFTEKEFSKQLRIAFSKYRDSPDQFETEFIHLCDPIAKSKADIVEGTTRIPSPYDSIYAVLIARGNVQLGDFRQALTNIDPKLDSEIESGLKILGCESSSGLIKNSRRNPLLRFLGRSDRKDGELCEKFLEGLHGDNFIAEVLLPFIAARMSE